MTDQKYIVCGKPALYRRKEKPAHGYNIYFFESAKKVLGHDLERAVNWVFRGHFPKTFLPERLLGYNFGYLSDDNICRLFYDKYCVLTHFNNGTEGVVVENEEMESILFHDSIYDPGRNVVFITGDVGTGKSTQICKFLYDRRDLTYKTKRLIVRIDIDHSHLDILNTKYILDLEGICKLIYEGILSKGDTDLKKYEIDINGPDYARYVLNENSSKSYEDRLRDLVKDLSEDGISLTIFVDNIDMIVYQYIRHKFTGIESAQFEKTINNLNSFLQFIMDDAFEGVKGLAFIIAARKETYLEFGKKFKDRLQPSSIQCYSIEAKDTNQIIVAYLKLLEEIINDRDFGSKEKSVEEKAYVKGVLTENINRLIKDVEGNNGCLSDSFHLVLDLSYNGLRGVVSLCSVVLLLLITNSVTEDDDNPAGERLITQFHPMPLLVMLNRKRLYSQIMSLFPNLYLVSPTVSEKDMSCLGGGMHLVTGSK